MNTRRSFISKALASLGLLFLPKKSKGSSLAPKALPSAPNEVVMTQDAIEDAATFAAVNGMHLTEIRVDPAILSAYNKIAFKKERIILTSDTDTGKIQWRTSGVTRLSRHKQDYPDLGKGKIVFIMESTRFPSYKV